MPLFDRLLNIELQSRGSAFLWGARKTGKSTYLKERFPQSIIYDFLKTDLFLDFSKRPSLLREQLLAFSSETLRYPIILDEVQKVPLILDEVHWLIEQKGLQFILCGSSARKLKRGQANLLGGRAWRYELYPLVSAEIQDFDLIRSLNHGLIPDHYLSTNYQKSLQSYVQDYLKEEVFAEGLTRNVPAFSRFFEAMGYSHEELTNYSNIARDCGVDAKTVREYYQILVDTLLGDFVLPFKKRQNRQVITRMPKFYLFDVGVAGYLNRRHITDENGEAFGKALEHLIFMELRAYRSYKNHDVPIQFWRTKYGQEVDFILGEGEIAIEVKASGHIDSHDLHGLQAFGREYTPKRSIVVCTEKQSRLTGNIKIMPWNLFLKALWDGSII